MREGGREGEGGSEGGSEGGREGEGEVYLTYIQGCLSTPSISSLFFWLSHQKLCYQILS